MSGNQLTWTYLKSPRPLPEMPLVDFDELVSIDAQRLVLRSKRSGKTNTFQRTAQ
jgi:hypothetical protein